MYICIPQYVGNCRWKYWCKS